MEKSNIFESSINLTEKFINIIKSPTLWISSFWIDDVALNESKYTKKKKLSPHNKKKYSKKFYTSLVVWETDV